MPDVELGGGKWVVARANEIYAEFWEDASEVGTDAAVWNLARALAFYEYEAASAAGAL